MATTGLLPITATLLLLFSIQIQAQTAPAPAPSGPPNVTAILVKGGQYTTFIRLLNETRVDEQLQNQLNNTHDGFTIFAPTDNAFNNLKAGALNGLNDQEKVQLILYHITPKFYTLSDLLTVSNPVRTQASGQEGGNWGLYFTGQGNQVNVSSKMVETQVNNALSQAFPLAIYQVDKVLLPEGLFGVKPPSAAPAPATKKSDGSKNTSTVASEPSSDNGSSDKNGSGRFNGGLGFVFGLGLACMAFLC